MAGLKKNTTKTTLGGGGSSTLLLAVVILLSSVISLASSASLLHPRFLEKAKHPKVRQSGDCNIDMDVSAICYQCGELFPTEFQRIHSGCCASDGQFRRLCSDWYTEEPKRGRRDTWYY